jgi:hypothetical protein
MSAHIAARNEQHLLTNFGTHESKYQSASLRTGAAADKPGKRRKASYEAGQGRKVSEKRTGWSRRYLTPAQKSAILVMDAGIRPGVVIRESYACHTALFFWLPTLSMNCVLRCLLALPVTNPSLPLFSSGIPLSASSSET